MGFLRYEVRVAICERWLDSTRGHGAADGFRAGSPFLKLRLSVLDCYFGGINCNHDLFVFYSLESSSYSAKKFVPLHGPTYSTIRFFFSHLKYSFEVVSFYEIDALDLTLRQRLWHNFSRFSFLSFFL